MPTQVDPPLALLAELTHRCPLRCPYCSNPVELERSASELSREEWQRVFTEAAALGVLQVHLSGGEPMVRRDLPALIATANGKGIYTNLITSGTLGGEAELREFAAAGLKHVQLSFQDFTAKTNDRIAGLAGAHEKKMKFAAAVRAVGLPLTVNMVVHRQNLAGLPQMIDMAQALGARRLEIAHVQYYAWALINRAAFLPSREQLDEATRIVEAARERLKGVLAIDYIVPDYHAVRPKSCMNGWARQFLNVTPSGKAVPCHAAETIKDLDFPSVREQSLADIWYRSEAFNKFRGTDWMPEPCQSCDRREIDWGGCRCQALMLAGDAARTDPVCALSPDHVLVEQALNETSRLPAEFVYRHFS
ncbi:MAG TPA: pyrroloquinoline quinone biosynthesis protein PqqE [Reyranella sp.]|nr:pyrroloquinoline quinone biosynthesis protein PqqE [Reyranella sp.]